MESELSEDSLPPKRSRWRYLLYVTFALFAAEALFFVWVWPDWDELRAGRVPASALIKDYQDKRENNPKLPPLRWTPVQKPFPRSIKNVFVIAEDSRFFEHNGLDFEALGYAVDYNWRHGKILIGASTISQQTAKNMFLSLSRNPLRKWHELLLTYLLEAQLSKAEILHVYLNVAEFGPGIFGLEAAARHYYKIGAHQLSSSQAVELAASLPSPQKNNPKSRTRPFQKRVQRIAHTVNAVDRYAAQARSSNRAAAAEELQKKLDELRQEMNENPSEPVSVETSESIDAPAEQSLEAPENQPVPSENPPASAPVEGSLPLETSDAAPPAEAPPEAPAEVPDTTGEKEKVEGDTP